MEVHAMIKLVISFVNVPLVMKEQTVKLVSTNNQTEIDFFVYWFCVGDLRQQAAKCRNIYVGMQNSW